MHNAPTLAERLIAAAAKSQKDEQWITRQLMAGQKPSQILATLDRSIDAERLVGAIGGDGRAGLGFACILMLVTPFVLLGWVLPT